MPSAGRSKASDRHQAKKPFQPQITSFFSSSSLTSNYPHSKEVFQIDDQDADIQSSLLSVGMRIRKAVPEGYKTHKTQLFTESMAYAVQSHTAPSYSKSRELTPFCGIHRVGGLGIQESTMNQYEYSAGSNTVNAYAVDGWFSSQESNASVYHQDSAMENGGAVDALSNGRLGSKRRHGDGDEDEETLWGSRFSTMSSVEGRYIAQPRSRRKGATVSVPSIPTIDMDFEEASFLQLDEVEMGGI